MFYINDFVNYLIIEKNLSQNTVKAYTLLLNHFKRYFVAIKTDNVKNISLEMIENFFMVENKKSGNSKYYSTTVIRIIKYFKFLEEKGIIFISPLEDYKRPKVKQNSYPVLTELEITEIIKNIRIKNNTCLKGKAIIELAYSSALRPREIYDLKISDIDFKEETLFIEQSKNNKDRKVPVGKTALFWLDKYIQEVRPKYINNNSHDYVFISHNGGKKLTGFGIRSAIRKTMALNNLDKMKPYSLRATSATVLYQNGMNIFHLSKLLGHVELNTTKIYLRLSTTHLKSDLCNKHPRNKLGNRKGDTQC